MTKLKIPSKKKAKPKTNNTDKVSTNVFQQIKEKYVAFKGKILEIKDLEKQAFDRMFEFGELLLKHEAEVKTKYGTWAEFAKEEGMNASTISRCKASVSDFKKHGANTLKQAKDLLKDRGHLPSAKIMENNINRLLTDGDKAGEPKTPKQKSIKHERHVDELRKMSERAEEIMAQHDPDEEIYQEAAHIKEFVGDTVNYMESLDISQKNWNNRAYLNFCRNIRYDVVLAEPVDITEPHHLSPSGDSGSQGGKVADFYAIPVSRKTHEKLHGGEIEPTPDEIAHFHRWTLVNFIMHTIGSDTDAEQLDEMEEAEIVN